MDAACWWWFCYILSWVEFWWMHVKLCAHRSIDTWNSIISETEIDDYKFEIVPGKFKRNLWFLNKYVNAAEEILKAKT